MRKTNYKTLSSFSFLICIWPHHYFTRDNVVKTLVKHVCLAFKEHPMGRCPMLIEVTPGLPPFYPPLPGISHQLSHAGFCSGSMPPAPVPAPDAPLAPFPGSDIASPIWSSISVKQYWLTTCHLAQFPPNMTQLHGQSSSKHDQ